MSLRELKIQLDLDDNASAGLEGVNSELDGMESTVDDTRDGVSDLGHETNTYGHESKSALETVNSNWNLIAGAIAGAGVALEAVVRKYQAVNLETERMAILTTATSDEIRDAAVAQADHTFSVEDNLRARQRLVQHGYREQDVINELLPLFDRLSDATGGELDIVDAIDIAHRSLHGLGDDLHSTEDYLDTFTFIQTQTSAEMQDLRRVIIQLGDDFEEMGMDVDDLAILFSVMGENADLGSGMLTKVRQAVDEGKGSQDEFYRAMGYTNDELMEAEGRLGDAEGSTLELADAFDENHTALQRMQSDLDILGYKYSNLATDIDILAPILTGLGGAMAAWKFMVWPALSAVAVKLGTVITAAGGIKAVATGLAIVGAKFVAIGAVIGGALYGMYRVFTDFEGSVVGVIDFIFDTAESIRDFNWSVIPDTIGGAFNSAVEFVQNIDWAELGKNVVSGIISGVEGMFSNLDDTVTSIGEHFRDRLTDFFGIESDSKLMMAYGANIMDGLATGIRSKSAKVVDTLSSFGEQLQSKFTDFWGISSDSKLMLEYGSNIMGGLDTGMQDSAPDKIPTPSVSYSPVMAGGGFSPTVNINVTGFTGDATELADKINRQVKSVFNEQAEKYFSSQRRRRPRKREEELN